MGGMEEIDREWGIRMRVGNMAYFVMGRYTVFLLWQLFIEYLREIVSKRKTSFLCVETCNIS